MARVGAVLTLSLALVLGGRTAAGEMFQTDKQSAERAEALWRDFKGAFDKRTLHLDRIGSNRRVSVTADERFMCLRYRFRTGVGQY